MDIHINDTDDPLFINISDNVITNLVNTHVPNEVFIVRIDNWFDHKWLRFSGIGVVEFPERGVGLPKNGHAFIESAKEEFHQEKITFPPFAPKRILSQQYFIHEHTKEKGNVHFSYKRPSSLNLQNRIENFSKSGIFFWLSSNTRNNSQGSLMVYITEKDSVVTWYASFSKKDRWKIHQVKGISNNELEYLIKNHTTSRTTGLA